MNKLSAIPLLLPALAFASAAACGTKASDTPNAKAALAIGAAAPDFPLPDADGRRFLVKVPVEETAPAPATLVLNWTADLKR